MCHKGSSLGNPKYSPRILRPNPSGKTHLGDFRSTTGIRPLAPCGPRLSILLSTYNHQTMDAEKNIKASNGNAAGDVMAAHEPSHKNPDTVPDHNAELRAQIAAMSPEEYSEAEKKLVRKIDLHIIPWIT